MLRFLTYLLITLRTLFDSLFVFFQTLFCLQTARIFEFPFEISVFGFNIPLSQYVQLIASFRNIFFQLPLYLLTYFCRISLNFYTTVVNVFVGLIILEIVSYYFHFLWSNFRSSLNLVFRLFRPNGGLKDFTNF